MKTFSQTLIEWYEAHRRDLPWRGISDPYRVWISEVILQQTRVSQGYDYYCRFVEHFPDVASLAAAPADEVMRYWQGLGYYSRARNLHRAARSMAGGTFPTTYEGVRALPGVGPYTAAAICSLAYSMPMAVVDGNVYRVLARYLGIDVPIDSTQGRKLFMQIAQELLDPARPALHNQAMMDLGATICTPRRPLCADCPLATSCLALAEGREAQLPVKQQRTALRHRYLNYIVVRMGDDSLLLRRRNENDIWQGLYELPLVEADHELSIEQLLCHPRFEQFSRGLMTTVSSPHEPSDVGHPLPALRPIVQGVKHVLTHRILHVNFYELCPGDDFIPPEGFLRVTFDNLAGYAMPALLTAFLEKYL